MSEQDRSELLRHEEELRLDRELAAVGSGRARKDVDAEPAMEEHSRPVERVAAEEGDSGEIETLPDGSVSIPVLEEELVVTKRTVVRERIVIRKETVTEHQRVDADLRRERVELAEEPSGGGEEAG